MESNAGKRMQRRVLPSEIAGSFAFIGDTNKAFEYLERGFSEEDPDLILCIRFPAFDSIRSDPRYADFMRRLGLPQ